MKDKIKKLSPEAKGVLWQMYSDGLIVQEFLLEDNQKWIWKEVLDSGLVKIAFGSAWTVSDELDKAELSRKDFD